MDGPSGGLLGNRIRPWGNNTIDVSLTALICRRGSLIASLCISFRRGDFLGTLSHVEEMFLREAADNCPSF